jgi:hypothetical protein
MQFALGEDALYINSTNLSTPESTIMKRHFVHCARFIPAAVLFVVFFALTVRPGRENSRGESEEGNADAAFNFWYNQRALPAATIPEGSYLRSHRYLREAMMGLQRKPAGITDTAQWKSIGPDNVGGRVLALAVNPGSTNILWAGAAGGGLWKSTTSGIGSAAWTRVETGFPSLAVSSIVIDPAHPSVMYIGTGEIGSVYGRPQVGTPGARSTYGLGILKSTDGGNTWSQTGLIRSFTDIHAIQKIVINPRNTSTLYTATTEGTFKSTDGGTTWTNVKAVQMNMDIVINPVDTTILYSAFGQRNSATNPGLYKSTDAGATWTLLGGGLPASNFGRTCLSIYPKNPSIVYAGIADASSSGLLGLYRTTNAGSTWSLASTVNYVGSQGWYDNVIAVNPLDSSVVYCAGLDVYKSTDNGLTLVQKSYWYNYYFGVVPAGGPEGTNDYCHADDHAIAFDPIDPSIVYFGNDGGIFVTQNGATSFEGRNGGFVTTQFYNGFGNASGNASVALGGTQDNGSLKYVGTNSWSKVFGGDGGWGAVDPTNQDVLYTEYVYLDLSKSTDGGNSWAGISNGLQNGSAYSNFIAPFVIAPSNPSVLYAGAKAVFKSTDGGSNWNWTNGGNYLNGNMISCIGVSSTSPDTLIAGTGSGAIGAPAQFDIFYSHDGGTTWTISTTWFLPLRYPTDIAFDPADSRVAYLTYSGYGNSHVFQSTDAGATWADISANLPDVPAQSIVVDPFNRSILFVGTDLGIFVSYDNGQIWYPYNDGMPVAMILDLTVSTANYSLRAATFGNGIYERQLPNTGSVSVTVPVQGHWNMLSVPVRVDDASRPHLFPDAISNAFMYTTHYVTADTLQNGTGYWLKFAAEGTVSIAGSTIAAETIAVHSGWNLIGSMSIPVAVSGVTSIPGGLQAGNFFGYEGRYVVADTIRPGFAYWINAKGNGSIILGSHGPSGFAGPLEIVPTGEMPPLPPDLQARATDALPMEYALRTNYPNPANPTTVIPYELPAASRVTISIVDINGRLVQRIFDGTQTAGSRTVRWNASAVASGVYFCRFDAAPSAEPSRMFSASTKILVVK